jgi:hypothetical protein
LTNKSIGGTSATQSEPEIDRMTMHKGKSPLAETIRREAAHAHQGNSDDYENLYHGCDYLPGGCQLALALEALFAGKLSHELTDRVLHEQPNWKENEILYAPHPTSEGKVGFDYSIGYYRGLKRVRWMHKHAAVWCDEPSFEWKPKSADKTRCQNHALKLIGQLAKGGENMRPFLVVSLCYCVHEYRRMGRGNVPEFDDPRRWIIADLRPLLEWQNKIKSGTFVLNRGPRGDSANWEGKEESMNLPLWSLQDFLEEQSKFLTE